MFNLVNIKAAKANAPCLLRALVLAVFNGITIHIGLIKLCI